MAVFPTLDLAENRLGQQRKVCLDCEGAPSLVRATCTQPNLLAPSDFASRNPAASPPQTPVGLLVGSQQQRAAALTYLSLCSAVRSRGPSGECSEDWGSGGGGDSRGGFQEVRPKALGGLSRPLLMPPAALPSGTRAASELPLPSILKRQRSK